MTSLEIRRFGPILEGEIELSPLTVLVGPNGSGKSYAAMVLHSLSKGVGSQSGRPHRFPMRLADRALRDLGEESREGLVRVSEQIGESGEGVIDPELFQKIVEYFYELAFEANLNDNLEAIFATDLSELIRAGNHRSFRFDIWDSLGHSRTKCSKHSDGVYIQSVPKIEDGLTVELNGEAHSERGLDEVTFDEESNTLSIPPQLGRWAFGPGEPEGLLMSLFSFLSEQPDLRYRSGSHYLPAGRAGLLQSHEVLTTGAFQRLSKAGLQRIEVPAFSGVVSDYLTELVSLSRRTEGELEPLAAEFQEATLGGEVIVRTSEEKPHPEFIFKQAGREFQLHLASTSVSELAPLILYTKYILTSSSTIVVEEPEAHLHPENQRRVAYFIGKLVKAGVRVIVTTHSDFFIEQLNNSVRAACVPTEKLEEEDLEDLPQIHADNISVHVFSGGVEEGFRIDQLEIDPVEGIPLDEFDRVHEELYGETYQVDRLLEEVLSER